MNTHPKYKLSYLGEVADRPKGATLYPHKGENAFCVPMVMLYLICQQKGRQTC